MATEQPKKYLPVHGGVFKGQALSGGISDTSEIAAKAEIDYRDYIARQLVERQLKRKADQIEQIKRKQVAEAQAAGEPYISEVIIFGPETPRVSSLGKIDPVKLAQLPPEMREAMFNSSFKKQEEEARQSKVYDEKLGGLIIGDRKQYIIPNPIINTPNT